MFSGGAANVAGSDYQQRVGAFFTLYMGLGLDCSVILENPDNTKINRVSFETNDAIDDIVLTHPKAKSFLQVKRKLSIADKESSEFFKVIDQFVRQFRISQNKKDSYIVVTTGDSPKSVIKDLKKLTNSARLSQNALSHIPLNNSELSVYNKLLSCIQKSAQLNGYGVLCSEAIEQLIRQIHIVVLDIEQNATQEKSFLTLLEIKLSVQANLIWSMVINQTLTWAKNRQSVDVSGVGIFLNHFVKEVPAGSSNELENYFKVSFDPENYELCCGRDIVLIDSLIPEFDLMLAESYRFDEEGSFRLKFHEDSVELSNGARFKLYGRFATFKGAERFIEESSEFKDKSYTVMPINGENYFDESPVAVAYSDKVRRHIIENNDATVCIHCLNGLSFPSILIEIQEENLPFDAGSIHPECLRVSDRVLGVTQGPGEKEEYPEFYNFDFNKWLSLLPNSQGLWYGLESANQAIKNVVWNSEPIGNPSGAYCVKVSLKDGSQLYVIERGKVQRFNRDAADKLCLQLQEWRRDAAQRGSPLCCSPDGSIFGPYDDLQKNSNSPLELLECEGFAVVKFTRGIATRFDLLKNYYAPLILFVDKISGTPITTNGTIFLLTSPIELKAYLNNWRQIGFKLQSYRLDIIESDEQFDNVMEWTKSENVQVLVDPFFDKSSKLLKGSVIEDLQEINKSKQNDEEEEDVDQFSLLFTILNEDGTYTQLFRDFVNDITLLLNDKCSSGDCRCMACQMYDARIHLYGNEDLDIRQVNENTWVLNLSDGETEWEEKFLVENSVPWEEWEHLFFADDKVGAASPLR